MTLRILVVAVFGGALLLAPTPASAKGPDGVELRGPGLDEPLRIARGTEAVRIDRRPGPGAHHVAALAQAAHLYGAFGSQTADALSPAAPKGERGPRYVATYSMPGSGSTSIRQHLYPFAEGGPLAYTPPGQSLFGAAARGGGWQRADESLDSLLVSFGIPAPAGAELEWVTYRDYDTGLSISYPPSWRPAMSTVAPLLIDPIIPLAIGTYDFPTKGCGMAPGPALEALGSKDAFIAVYVFRAGASWGAMVPHRPTHFGPDVPWFEGPGKCADNVRGTIRSISFPDRGLQLKVMVAIGSNASAQREQQAFQILDTLTVDPILSG